MTAEDIKALLVDRYRLPEWILAFEVGNGTGGHLRRHADAVAMNCFPSKGLEILGFEIKISRADWQRELKQSAKAVPVGDYCDRWYVIAPDGVVLKEELPKAWGLMTVKARGGKLDQLYVVVNVSPREDVKPINRTFMASMLRNVGRVDANTLSKVEERARNVAEERLTAFRRENRSSVEHALEHLKAQVRTFEEASGVSIEHEWDLGKIGSVLRILRESGNVGEQVSRWSASVTKNALALAEAVKSFKEPTA